jgi:hypothetical protein
MPQQPAGANSPPRRWVAKVGHTACCRSSEIWCRALRRMCAVWCEAR